MSLEYLLYAAIFLLLGFWVFRIVVRRDYRDISKLTPLAYLLEILVFATHANLSYLFLPAKWPGMPSLPDNFTLIIVALIFFCTGGGILLFAWFGLGSSTSLGQDKRELNTTGLYRYSRNPQLVGYGLLLSSLAVLYLSWGSVIWFLEYVIVAYFMIKSEEEFLQLRYGNAYEEYCRAVPRVFKIA